MPRIVCTQPLWIALGPSGRTRPPRQATVPGARLGQWAAALVHEGATTVVLGFNYRTFLTLVAPFEPEHVRPALGAALERALAELGVDAPEVAIERAALDHAPLAYGVRGPILGPLNTARFTCGLELLYHDDLARVQTNLNDFPHGELDVSLPKIAVRRLFAPQELRRRQAH